MMGADSLIIGWSMTRPIKATIDFAALRHNHALASRRAQGARVWTVVKADAYGHGLSRVARALGDLAHGYALVELEGAVALRRLGLRQPILLLEGYYGADELPLFAQQHLTPAIHCMEQVRMLTAATLAAPLPVYLKLNTGMNRLGFNEDELPAAYAALSGAPQVADITLMTHFADADGERGISAQEARCVAMWTSLGQGRALSLANSAALLGHPQTRNDWVRPGIMLYGGSPFPERSSAAELDLRPVMTLASELIALRQLQPGDRVGYGGLFTAERPMRIGVVACGYADGYPRHAGTGAPVLVEGRRTQLLGRVSMDKICVDLTGIDDARVGSPVTLWGGQATAYLAADDVATAAGTVSYELFCALAARVPVFERT